MRKGVLSVDAANAADRFGEVRHRGREPLGAHSSEPGRAAAAHRCYIPDVELFSRRLPHVVTRADLVAILTPTYAAARGVDDEEAAERLAQALAARGLPEDLYGALSAGLRDAKGPRTDADALLDRLSAGVQARRSRVRAAPDSPGRAAVLVRIDLEIGVAPETMRATLATPRGRAVLDEGLLALGRYVVRELLKG